MSRLLALLGIGLTIAYAVFMYFIFGNPLPALKEMELNSVGDFLAGVFGPVAILWLILGFFQQGLELRQNNEALRLQAEELKNSVEQQKELVEVTRSQVAADLDSLRLAREEARRAIQPMFVVERAGGSHSGDKHALRISVVNMGAPVTGVTFRFSGDFKNFSSGPRVMDKGAAFTITIHIVGSGDGLRDELSIVYLDASNAAGMVRYLVEVDTVSANPALKVSRLED
ncbi:hypothetical protein ACIUV8_23500 [Pseudomonas aeruginosa]|uniref:hypothetical protein n=1 Tax=Pseudomonas aeruginosa TaxID=287 RepID=UPI002F3F3533|nr:hypothetical protein [Pseudomonas aeruginosa]